MIILLRDFNEKVWRENIFNPTTGKESLIEDSNDNDFGIGNLATTKNLVVKSKMFPHRNKNTPEALLMGRSTKRLIKT